MGHLDFDHCFVFVLKSHVSCLLCTAKELIEALLKTDPDKRLSIHQVMKHKWIAVRSNVLTNHTAVQRISFHFILAIGALLLLSVLYQSLLTSSIYYCI